MKKLMIAFIALIGLGFASCEVEEVLNPNSPTVESFENGATLADLQLLGQGLQSVIRDDMEFHFWTVSILGREYYDLRGTDPRYTSELLGQNGGSLDNNGFITTRSYFGRHRSVRNANLLKTAVQNASATLSPGEVNSFLGFANTITGYEMLLEANRQFENGLRLDTADPINLGPFAPDYNSTLEGIKAVLDEGYGQLTNASANFLFELGDGMFSTIPGYDDSQTAAVAQFNRGILARLEILRGNKAEAATALGDSFMDMAGDMNAGGYYAFGGNTGNDRGNPLFFVPGVDNYMAHPTWIADATAGDARLSKATQATLIELDGLSGDHQVTVYSSNTDPASIQRNEELILIMAEARIGGNNAGAVEAINVVRKAAGLADYSGGMSDAELEDELLYQRRYSLFAEGHRWIDLRRYGRLSEIPTDRAGDVVHVQFPRPASEN